jgi:hypothetical protein
MSEDSRYRDLSELLPNHCQDFEALLTGLLTYHNIQENTYKRSFAKRGEIGVWMNLMRKIDRIDGIAESLFEHGDNGMLLVDTLIDSAVYSIKWLAVIGKIRPKDLHDWLAGTFCPATNISIAQARKMFGLSGPGRKLTDTEKELRDNLGGRSVPVRIEGVNPSELGILDTPDLGHLDDTGETS